MSGCLSGDPLGIHDQSDTEGGDNEEKCANKTSKIFRGIILMLLISFSWVGSLYLMKISFQSEKTLFAVKAFTNESETFSTESTENQQISQQVIH